MSNSPVSAQSLPGPADSWLPGRVAQEPAATGPELQSETIGRYTLHRLIGVGGIASVYMGTSSGAADFSRVVAIKRMHPPFAQNPAFVARFRDEAWLCARLLHPNVVQTLDVVEWKQELLLVMEYVEGVTLQLLQSDAFTAQVTLPPSVALGILVPALHGLHDAHEATDDDGRPLGIVHRDCTPHNLMIGRDGNTKVLDFGIARARGQMHVTSAGELWGKFGYLAPEQIYERTVDRRADVFAAAVVLWEMLTGQRLFRERGLSDAGIIQRVLYKVIPAPSSLNPAVARRLDEVVMMALDREPTRRFESARAFASALESALPPATSSAISSFVEQVSKDRLIRLADLRADVRRRTLANSRAQAESARSPHPDEATELAPPLPVFTRLRDWSWRHRRTVAAVALALTVIGIASIGVRLRQRPSPALGETVASANSTDTSEPGARASGVRIATQSGSALAQDTTGAARGSAQPVPDRVSEVPPPGGGETVALNPGAPPKGGAAKAVNRRKVSTPERHARDSAAKASGSAHANPECDPPTYLDSDGIRHFRDGCL